MNTPAVRPFRASAADQEGRSYYDPPPDDAQSSVLPDTSGERSATAGKQGRSQSAGKERLHITLTPRQLQRMEYLKKRTEAGSYAEVIRNAMSLYDTLIQEVDAGGKVLVEDAQGNLISYRVILPPAA